MQAERQPFTARFTRWALDHPWGYAGLFSASFFMTWTASSVAFGSGPVLITAEAALLGFLPTLVFMRWVIARPSVRRRWERRATERPPSAEA